MRLIETFPRDLHDDVRLYFTMYLNRKEVCGLKT